MKNKNTRRIKREKKTVEVTIKMYCRDHHNPGEESTAAVDNNFQDKNINLLNKGLCEDCKELLKYALYRLEKCPFGEGKTTCAKCPVHCYKPAEREKIRAVMRYSGPKMPARHPILALFHFIDGARKEPVKSNK